MAVGGQTETLSGEHPIYIFDRETGALIRRICDDLLAVAGSLTISPDGRYLAVTVGGNGGLRIFDRSKDWTEAFRDNSYGGVSYGASFARGGRLATTSLDGYIRLYEYDLGNDRPNFSLNTQSSQNHSWSSPLHHCLCPGWKSARCWLFGRDCCRCLRWGHPQLPGRSRPQRIDRPSGGTIASPRGGTNEGRMVSRRPYAVRNGRSF